MLNRSKINDPRQWDRWRAAGSVEGMDAARRRARTTITHVPAAGITVVETVAESPPPAPPEGSTLFTGLDGVVASVTVPDAARALGVHPTTIRRRLARGTYQGDQDANGVWTITDPEIVAAVNGAG